MCLIALAWQMAEQYPLTLIGNRDEFHQRPARPAQPWAAEGMPYLLAGKDLEAGGTWLGVTRNGRFAALTNIRTPGAMRGPLSRGKLVLDYLDSALSPERYLAPLSAEASDYAGFNLLVGDREQLWYLNSLEGRPRRLPAGVYGLSNAALDTPWPKLSALRDRLAAQHEAGADRLLSLLHDDQIYADALLPNTGVNRDLERMLSAAFIRGNQDYGTRACSLLRLHAAGEVELIEQRFGPQGEPQGESRWLQPGP
ncbi:NRDE family protein [Halopseudomonas sabulinigri]|uniref:NRDE family protein n=1 Tax=Halopseudomonas sabulinigri TaxID=472181 RepID=A0ABP9ZNZ3_9GAMM